MACTISGCTQMKIREYDLTAFNLISRGWEETRP